LVNLRSQSSYIIVYVTCTIEKEHFDATEVSIVYFETR